MATYTTRTHEFGKVLFTAPAATDDYAGYVWLETEDGHRRQICYGGDFRGNTIATTSPALKAEAQRWLRMRREWQRREGM